MWDSLQNLLARELVQEQKIPQQFPCVNSQLSQWHVFISNIFLSTIYSALPSNINLELSIYFNLLLAHKK